MPIIEVKTKAGKTKKVKERLIKGITKAAAEALDIPVDHVTIIINEVPRDLWVTGGKTT
jgi:4-oxalocrotonate tautomerase family enzyme